VGSIITPQSCRELIWEATLPGSLHAEAGEARSGKADLGHGERGAQVPQPCIPALALVQGRNTMRSKDGTPSFSTHTAQDWL